MHRNRVSHSLTDPRHCCCQSVPAPSSCLHSTRLKPQPLLVWLLQLCLQKHGGISGFAASLFPHIHTPCLKSPPPPPLLALQAPFAPTNPSRCHAADSLHLPARGWDPHTHSPHTPQCCVSSKLCIAAGITKPAKAKRAAGPPPRSPLLCFFSFFPHWN